MGTVRVFLDEAFSPRYGVCAYVLEDDIEFSFTETRLAEISKDLDEDNFLSDMPSYEALLSKGFHTTGASFEETIPLRKAIFHEIPGRAFILECRPTHFDDFIYFNKLKAVLVLYCQVVNLVLRRYRERDRVDFIFENHQQMNKFFHDLVARQVTKVHFRGEWNVTHKPKGDPLSLILPDLCLWVVGDTLHVRDDPNASGAMSAVRNYRSIASHISLIKSLDDGVLATRHQPLLACDRAGVLSKGRDVASAQEVKASTRDVPLSSHGS